MCSGYSVTSVSDGSSEFYVAGAPRAVHRGQVVVYSLNGQNQPVIIDSQRGDQVLVCLWSLMSFSFVTHWNHWGVWFADRLLFWQCSLSYWCGRWRCDGSAAGRSADVHEREEVWNRTSLPLHHYQGETDCLLIKHKSSLKAGPKKFDHLASCCSQGILSNQGMLEGPSALENARFGTAITAVPDLNLDGFSDVVVGAPLEGNGQGAIYIYYGDRNTIRKQSSQVEPTNNITIYIKYTLSLYILYLFIYM